VAEYRVICVVRGSDGDVRALGYSESGNDVMYDDKWTLEQAGAAIEEGHRLYTVSPSTGEQADMELYEGRVRIKPTADDLPECG
jgi:hypothetical protein